jgi:hypothetical protein
VSAPRGADTVDLQVHSTASDGVVAPEAIPAAAVAAGLSAFALTDHDSVSGIAAAVAAAAPLGIRVVPGVELSATDDAGEVHVLGLHIDPAGVLERELAAFRTQREHRADAIVAKLRELGANISIEDVRREAADGAMGRPHIARALIARGECRDLRDAFDRYLGAGRPAFVAKPRLTVSAAADIIHASGGLAIWAHPGADGRRDRVEAMIAAGLDGVEVRHPGHSDEDARRLLALCDHFSLVPSGGSDWHGDASGRRMLGGMQVPAAWLQRQDERVAARRGAGIA